MTTRQIETWAAKINKSIAALAARKYKHDPGFTDRINGRPAGAFYIVATDGHRALLKRGAGRGEPVTIPAFVDNPDPKIMVTADLVAAVGRMRACNSSRTRFMTLEPDADRIVVSTIDPNDQTNAAEWVPIAAPDRPSISVGLDYVREAVAPGILIDWYDPKQPIVVATPCDTYRVIIAPAFM